jgi:agmatine deiminase
MHRALVLIVCGLAAGCVEIHRPGELSPQEYVILGTPTYETAVGLPTEPIQYAMIAGTLPEQQVLLVVNDMAECRAYEDTLVADYGVTEDELDGLRCEKIEHSDIWFRDMGGVFVHASLHAPGHPQHGVESLAVVDYEFDGWGYGPYSDLVALGYYEVDDQVAAELGKALKIPVITSTLTTEGGAFVSNGAGTTLYSLGALTQRNPGWTQEQIEAELKRTLGADEVLALPEWHPLDGHAVLDGPLWLDGVPYQLAVTVRHADEFVDFLDEDTLLVSQMDAGDVRNDIDQQVKDMLDRTWAYLEAETDFELIAFPEAGFVPRTLTGDDAMWAYLGALTPQPAGWVPEGGQIAMPASYMNFVVTNGAVFVTTLYREGRDEKLQRLDADVVTLLGTLYPDREVIQVDAEAINVGGGGMHCITQEVVALQ